MASTPYNTHVYNVPNFDMIQDVQKNIINEVCSGVDEQLSVLISGEESRSNILLVKCIVSADSLWPGKCFFTTQTGKP